MMELFVVGEKIVIQITDIGTGAERQNIFLFRVLQTTEIRSVFWRLVGTKNQSVSLLKLFFNFDALGELFVIFID